MTEELPVYCAVALAGLDDLPDTIRTRSVIIRMRRRRPSERVEPWRYRIHAPKANRSQIGLRTGRRSGRRSPPRFRGQICQTVSKTATLTFGSHY